MTRLDKAAVLEALRAEDVAAALGICALGDQRWRGRWLRTHACARTHHNSVCFGLARDGMWHCWSCDEGGDLIDLIAAALGKNARADFADVLAYAAEIAGVEPEMVNPFGDAPLRRARPPRPTPPPLPPIEERIHAAATRAAWAWARLYRADDTSMIRHYLGARGLRAAEVLMREDVRATPLRLSEGLRTAIADRATGVSDELRTLWWTMGTRKGTWSIVVPVRSVIDGAILDLRCRRFEPEPGQPKIIGMVGGVTADAAQAGKPRRLIACYGSPHAIELAHVVVVEGLPDYLTALQVWPNAQVLGAVEAGSLSLVAGHAARALAARSDADARLTIVEQADPTRLSAKTGALVAGAADAAINEDPNAATKVAVRALGAHRIEGLYCADPDPAIKDLNDLVRAGRDPLALVERWDAIGWAGTR